MSRENKFRVFHEGSMWDVWRIEWHKGKIIAVSISNYPANQYLFESIIGDLGALLMETIGLTDKNGVEAFEGDIIKILRDDNEYITAIKVYGEVELPTLDHDYTLLKWADYEEFEIIGNIHENGDLL